MSFLPTSINIFNSFKVSSTRKHSSLLFEFTCLTERFSSCSSKRRLTFAATNQEDHENYTKERFFRLRKIELVHFYSVPNAFLDLKKCARRESWKYVTKSEFGLVIWSRNGAKILK